MCYQTTKRTMSMHCPTFFRVKPFRFRSARHPRYKVVEVRVVLHFTVCTGRMHDPSSHLYGCNRCDRCQEAHGYEWEHQATRSHVFLLLVSWPMNPTFPRRHQRSGPEQRRRRRQALVRPRATHSATTLWLLIYGNNLPIRNDVG